MQAKVGMRALHGYVNRNLLNQLLFLVVIPSFLFVPIAVITPTACADDGGYARILQHYLNTGIVDLMHWSMPNAVGLIIPTAFIMRFSDFSFLQLDLIGILFTLGACVATYRLLRAYQTMEVSLVLTLSLFCFMDISVMTPSFMTDLPFLCYTAWWLLLTQQILSSQSARKETSIRWFGVLLLAMLTRSTIILSLPGLVVSAFVCTSARVQLLRLSGLFVGCVVATFMCNSFLVVNPVGLLESTSLQKICFNHEWKLLDLRTAGIVIVYLLSASAPLLLAMERAPQTTQKYRFLLAILGFGLAAYFSVRGFIVLAPLVVLACTLGAYKLPSLISKFEETDKPFSIILICAIFCQIAIMPIMSHPLSRHAVPVMLEIIILCAMAKRFGKRFFWIYVPSAALLILANVALLQQERLKDFGIWTLGDKLISCGIRPDTIDAGWAWYCYYGLQPGVDFSSTYQERYRLWKENAKFRIVGGAATETGNDQVLADIPINYLGYAQSIKLLRCVRGTSN